MTGEAPTSAPRTKDQNGQNKKKRKIQSHSVPPKPEPAPFTAGIPPPLKLQPLHKFTFQPITPKEPEPAKKDEKKPESKDEEMKDADTPTETPAEKITGKPAAETTAAKATTTPAVNADKPKKILDPRLPKTRAYHKQLKSYTSRFGTRRYVQFIVCVGPHPQVFLFKTNEEFIPGGYLKADEDECAGMKRIWKEIFHAEDDNTDVDEEVEFKDVVCQWFRPEVADQVYPYKSRYISSVKEHIKTYLVELKKPMTVQFPSVFKELVIKDLYDVYDLKDPMISSIPSILSRYTFS